MEGGRRFPPRASAFALRATADECARGYLQSPLVGLRWILHIRFPTAGVVG